MNDFLNVIGREIPGIGAWGLPAPEITSDPKLNILPKTPWVTCMLSTLLILSSTVSLLIKPNLAMTRLFVYATSVDLYLMKAIMSKMMPRPKRKRPNIPKTIKCNKLQMLSLPSQITFSLSSSVLLIYDAMLFLLYYCVYDVKVCYFKLTVLDHPPHTDIMLITCSRF